MVNGYRRVPEPPARIIPFIAQPHFRFDTYISIKLTQVTESILLSQKKVHGNIRVSSYKFHVSTGGKTLLMVLKNTPLDIMLSKQYSRFLLRKYNARVQFVSATPVFVLIAFDCSLEISSSYTSLGVLYPRSSMGVSLTPLTIASSSSCVRSSKLVSLGR